MSSDEANGTDAAIDLTFYVACCNEVGGLIPTISTVASVMEKKKLSYELIVVDDASTDDSVQVLRSFMAANLALPVQLFVQSSNQNIGYNFAEAAFLGKGKYFKQVNAKNDLSAESLEKLLSYLGKTDLILPYHDLRHRPWLRRCLSSGFQIFVNTLYGRSIRYYNGLPIFRRTDVLRWHAHTHGFGYQAVLVTRLLDLGRTYCEVELDWQDRQSGKAKAFGLCNWFSVGHAVIELLAMRLSRLCYKNKVT